MFYSEIQTYAFVLHRRTKSYTRWIFFRGSFSQWVIDFSLPEIQQNFKCPTGEFTCKERQLYSSNGSLPFPVSQTVFSTPIETWVIFRMAAMNDNRLSHIKWAYGIKCGGASVCVCEGRGDGGGERGNVFKQNLSHLNNKINQSKPIKLTTMLYLITDNWHIVESGVKHQ